jgi:hypothetical protein
MTRDEQFRIIEKAKRRLLSWAAARGIPLANIEYVVPFVEDDFGLSVWLFYDTDASLAARGTDGSTEMLRKQCLAVLRELGYPERSLPEIIFSVDSHETVVRDYQGSYFYRLR